MLIMLIIKYIYNLLYGVVNIFTICKVTKNTRLFYTTLCWRYEIINTDLSVQIFTLFGKKAVHGPDVDCGNTEKYRWRP